jgi:hypothetical protein
MAESPCAVPPSSDVLPDVVLPTIYATTSGDKFLVVSDKREIAPSTEPASSSAKRAPLKHAAHLPSGGNSRSEKAEERESKENLRTLVPIPMPRPDNNLNTLIVTLPKRQSTRF